MGETKGTGDEMRLRYWAKIVRMDSDRIVKRIYRESKNRLEKEEAAFQLNNQATITKTWCTYTKQLMKKLNLEEEWRTEQIPDEGEWNSLIRGRIHEREQVKWRVKCLTMPKLRTYSKLKTKLKTEPYLEVNHRGGIPELAKLRGGTNRLRIEQGRYVKETIAERKCLCCKRGAVEDEVHFLLMCPSYTSLRKEMWQKFEAITGTTKTSLQTDEEKMNALIGERFQPEESEKNTKEETKQYRRLVRVVMRFISAAMQRRRGLLK